MIGLGLAAFLLAVPAWHQLVGHRVHRKILRAAGHGPEVPPTAHELAHRARSRPAQLAADVGWLVYLAAAVALSFMAR